MRHALLLPFLGAMTACQNIPATFPLPAQRAAVEDGRLYAATRILEMGDPAIAAFLVRGIGRDIEGGAWRWTGQRPTVRLRPRTNYGVYYAIEFTLPEATFKDTGPVTISYFVGDHLLDRVLYARAGGWHFDKLVPEDWITPQRDVELAAEVDKVWTSKIDGAKLGFVLNAMGLTQTPPPR